MRDDDGEAGRSAAWGVVATLFGGGAVALAIAAAPVGSTIPLWPAIACGVTSAAGLYMCFASLHHMWPVGRSVTQGSDISRASSSGSARPPDSGQAAQNIVRNLPQIALPVDGGLAPSMAISARDEEKAPEDARESLQSEKITLEFENGTALAAPRLLALLNDYYAEVEKGSLSGFSFSSSQIVPEWDSPYQQAKELYTQYLGREGLQLRRLERDLVEGVRLLLDITFIGGKQTIFSVLAVSNFTRLMLHRSIGLIRSQYPEALRGIECFRGFSGNPLSSNSQAAQFYGHDVILIDVWDPKDSRHVLKLWFPRDGYAGSWFSQGYFVPADPYVTHYHPPEHYGYVLPQAVARSLFNGDPVPVNFNEYMIGRA